MGNLPGWLRGRRSISWSCTENWGRTKPSWGYHCHHAGWHAIYTVKDKFAVSHGPKCLFYLKLFVLKWEIYVHDVTKVYLPKCIDTIVILVYLIDQESIVFTLCRWYNQHFSSHKHRCKNNKFIASREMFFFFFFLAWMLSVDILSFSATEIYELFTFTFLVQSIIIIDSFLK